MVWSQTVRFLWRALRMKYIIWRSPRGFLNNRIYWINGFVLRVGKRVGTSWHHVPCNLLFTNQGFGWWAQMWSEGLEPQGRIAQSIHAAWVQSPRFFLYTTLKQLFTCFQNRVAFQAASQLSPHSLSWHSCGRHTAIGDEVVSSLGNRTIVIFSWAVAPSLVTISAFSWFSHVSCSQVSALWLRALPPGHHAPPADLLTSIFGGSGSSSNNKQFVWRTAWDPFEVFPSIHVICSVSSTAVLLGSFSLGVAQQSGCEIFE